MESAQRFSCVLIGKGLSVRTLLQHFGSRMKNPSPAIVWFRRDLRLADNPALDHAVRSHAEVIPVFVWAPDEESPWTPGGASRWWLHHSLQALASQLAARGSRLILRQGPSGEDRKSTRLNSSH